MTTGCEIGVYNTTEPTVSVGGVFDQTFYNSASYPDQLHMMYVLKKKGQVLFIREDRHWWLTGFKLGEFSEPSELSVEYHILLKDLAMRDAFLKSLVALGYKEGEYTVHDREVVINYVKPYSKQPKTRTAMTDWLTQRKNEALCKAYRELTGSITDMPEKLRAVHKANPVLYKEMLDLRRTSQIPRIYDTVSGYRNNRS